MGKLVRTPGEVYKDKTSGMYYLYLGNISYKKAGKRVGGDTFVKLGDIDSKYNTTYDSDGVLGCFVKEAKLAVVHLSDGNVKTNGNGVRMNPKILVAKVPDVCLSEILNKITG